MNSLTDDSMQLPEVVRTGKTVVFAFATLLNAGVLYVVLKHSGPSMKSYSRLLVVSSTVDISLCIGVLATQPILIVDMGMSLAFFNGFTTWMPESVNLALYSITYFLFNAMFACSEVQFLCRYMIICRNCGTDCILRRAVPLFTVFVAIIAVQFAWDMHIEPDDKPPFVAVLRNFSWPFDEANPPPIFGCSYVPQPNLQTVIGGILASAHFACGYMLILFCEIRVAVFLRRSQTASGTASAYSGVRTALIIMALVPLVAAVLPSLIHIAFQLLGHSPTLALAIFTDLAGLSVVANPITTVVFIRPYRQAILRRIRKKFASASVFAETDVRGTFSARHVEA